MVNRKTLERSRVTVTPPHSACSESVGGPSGAARGAVAALPAHPRRRQEVFAAADGPPTDSEHAECLAVQSDRLNSPPRPVNGT